MRPAARALALALAAWAAPVAIAQVPDSTAVPADTLGAPPDSVAVPPDSFAVARPVADPVGPFPLVSGRVVTPVPATTAALDLAALLGDATVGPAPSAFVFRLGAPGRSAGAALDGQPPGAPALLLDGRPVTDLVTDAPRLDLLPLSAIGPLRLGDGALGRATALQTDVRAVRLGVPVTELRYHGGQNGVQHVSGTHAQTRRPPAFLRGGSDASRLTLTGHAASRSADGFLSGADGSHTDVLGRLLLTRPGVAAEVGFLYTDRTDGARTGVVPISGQPVTSVVDAATGTVLGGGATRRTLRAEPWARLRLPLSAALPTEVGGSVVLQRLVFVPGDGTTDTLRVHGRRLAAFAEQPLAVGGHALTARLDVLADAAPGPDTGALVGAEGRLGLHATVTDSLRLGRAALALGAGVHSVDGRTWPSASARATVGPLSAGVRAGARARSWLESVGLAGRVTPDATDATERTVAADVSVATRRGDWRLAARLFGDVTVDGRHLLALGDTASTVVVATGGVGQGGASLGVGWRERTKRGVYARLDGTARALLDPSTDLLARVDAALPRVWGVGRLGVRAEDVGDGVLDLDLAVRAQAWTAFRSVRVEPATGAVVLPEPGTNLGTELPARALVGLEATATFSALTSLFVRYDHALGERVVGAAVTAGEPLPPHVLRFGVFWALLN